MILYTTLTEVLRGCADTATCEEFVQRDGEWWAVVTNADLRAYADAHNKGTFAGKARCRIAFVQSGTGACEWASRDYPYDVALDLFQRRLVA